MAIFPITEENASTWRYINLVWFAVTAAANGLSAAGFFGLSQGEVSDDNIVFITPATFAFTIWSVIYFLQAFILVWGPCCGMQTKETESVVFGPKVMGYWYSFLSLCNSLWCIVFSLNTEASMWICLVLIIGMLSSLMKILQHINIAVSEAYSESDATEDKNRFDILTTLSLWLGFSIYAGWVTAATILNVTLGLNKSGWPTPHEDWSVFVAVFAAFLYPLVAYLRRDPVYSTTGAWAAFAIASKAKDDGFDKTSTAFAVVAVWLLTWSVLQYAYGYIKGGLSGYFFGPLDMKPIEEGKSGTKPPMSNNYVVKA